VLRIEFLAHRLGLISVFVTGRSGAQVEDLLLRQSSSIRHRHRQAGLHTAFLWRLWVAGASFVA